MLGRFRQDKIRNPNVEIRNNDQCSKSECPKRAGESQDFPAIGTQLGARVFRIRIWGFEFVSDFVFRASDLNEVRAPESCKAIALDSATLELGVHRIAAKKQRTEKR
jgi:hypothetical protein